MGKEGKTQQQSHSNLPRLPSSGYPGYEEFIVHLYQHIIPVEFCDFCYPPEYVEYPGPVYWEDQPFRWIEKIRFHRR